MIIKLSVKIKDVMVELTLIPSDNERVPDLPILLFRAETWKGHGIKHKRDKFNDVIEELIWRTTPIAAAPSSLTDVYV